MRFNIISLQSEMYKIAGIRGSVSKYVLLPALVAFSALTGNVSLIEPDSTIMQSHPCYAEIQVAMAEALRNGVYKETLPEIQVALQQCSVIADLDRARKMINEAIESIEHTDPHIEDLETDVDNLFETLNDK